MDNDPISKSYENYLATLCCESVGFSSAKKSHLGRLNMARYADAHNIEEAQIARMGKWNGNVLENNYLSLPYAMIHFTAGFDRDEPYYIPRDIKPPSDLQREIFPWLEKIIEQVKNRDESGLTPRQKDSSVPFFLDMLKQFRSILLQDWAVFSDVATNSIFVKNPIFKDPRFLKFKAQVKEEVRIQGV
ncbi:hypothetical protein JCM33374_g5616 [Metschnikowia sp. JCM 33374]|nr:hypothetical protein JCM33374_g5616 [Metschnikowia sp. JCM 33374]